MLTLVPAQHLSAQTVSPTVRRDRHVDREVRIRYPRLRATPEPDNGQNGYSGNNQVRRVGPASSGTRDNPDGPSAPLRRVPQ